MLQRQILFKQLQEMQQRQQLQELSDARQQNYANQLSYLNKQTSVGLHPPLVNGMPIHDASQMFMVGNMHLAQRGASPIIQGVPNELVFSQAQNQAVSSTGVLPQQIDASLYGTPIASSGNNMYQYSSIQGSAHNSANMLNRGNNNQVEIPVMQPSSVSNSFLNDQFNASPHKDSMSGGTFTPKSVVEDKNFFGQLLMQASDDGVLPANLQQLHFLQRNTAMKESDMRKEQDGWSAFSAGVTSKLNPSQGATSLDPLEEKILFNTDDDSWESSLGRQSNVGRVGFESTGVDFMGSFSSTQSGSWSALMQSAVAETSSSDTGQQEEWSGLSFQNPELSADFQHTNYIVDGKQSSWVDNNLQSISSPTSKAKILFQNSNTNYSFPTFQQSSHHVARQKEGMNSDPSLEFIQQSPKSASKWFDCNPHQKQPVEGCQSVQEPSLLQNIWHDQRLDPSKNDRRQTSLSRYTMGSQPGNNLTGHELKANVWMHESGPQPMVGGSQRPPEQTTHAWSNQEVGYVDNVANVRMSSKKVHSPDMQNSRASEEMPPRNNVDSLAALFDSSADFCSQSITSHAGENMLDLLNKADKSVEIRTGIHLGSRGSVPLSQEPQIQNCDNHLYYNSSVSQGFGLRLAPPSQQMPKSYSSPSSQLLGNSSVTNASGPLYLNNQLNNQYQPVAPAASQSPNAALLSVTGRYQAGVPASNIFQANLQDQKFPTLETLPVNQPSLISGVPHQIGISMGPPTMSQEHVLPSDVPMPNVFSNLLPSQDSINSNVDTATGTTQGFDYEDHHMDELNSSEVSPTSSHYQLIRGHEAVAKHLAGQNATTSVSMITATHHQALNTVEQRENNSPDMPERDLAALGRPLRPHRLQQKISLLHQVLANKRRQLIYGLKSGVINLAQDDPNAKVQLNSISTGDNKPMTYSSEASGDQDSGMLVFGKNDTHFHSKEQSQINAQVAPSWFKHCGTMKNGQMLPMYDLMLTKDAARQFSIGKSFEDFQVIGSIGQVNSSNANRLSGILPNSASKEVTATELTPPLLFPLDDNERNLAVLRPKKRKVAAFDRLPWHKEVTQGSQLLEKVGSMAESEWVLASNRLSERVEDEAETMEYVLPISRAKKRLVLATQLMQQVLRPAPAVILSADTCSNSESIVYFVARSALGDACRLTCDFHKPSLTSDKSSVDLIASERVGQLGFSKVAENFVDRAKRLENDFLRMDKTASIVDIKVDSQELDQPLDLLFYLQNRKILKKERNQATSPPPPPMAMSAATPHSLLLKNPTNHLKPTTQIAAFPTTFSRRTNQKPISITCSSATTTPPPQTIPSTSSDRVFNFAAGPATLPENVLLKAQSELYNWRGSGMSVMEMSHRGKEFSSIIQQAESDLRTLLNIPADYAVLFLQGGATTQFAAIPLNLCQPNDTVDYIVTGSWSDKAYKEAAKFSKASVIWSGKSEKYTKIPSFDSLEQSPDAKYLHICANETIHGVEFKDYPSTKNPNTILVADMSSNFCSKPVDVSKFGLIYAGAQKNVGPSGVTIVIIRKDLIGNAQPITPIMLDYKIHSENNSLYNTPPCYGIYMCGLVFEDLLAQGGLVEVEKKNKKKAQILYDAIDGSNGFYRCPVEKSVRSLMNVPFTLAKSELEAEFIKEAAKEKMVQLKGHRSVGGMRASIYNAMPYAGVEKLVAFMNDFQARHG